MIPAFTAQNNSITMFSIGDEDIVRMMN